MLKHGRKFETLATNKLDDRLDASPAGRQSDFLKRTSVSYCISESEVVDNLNITKINLRTFLGWCTVVNVGILVWWYLALIFAHDFIFSAHTWWFEMSKIALMKSITPFHMLQVGGNFFNVIPYLILRYAKFN